MLEREMKDRVEQDLPFTREVVPLKEAVEYFARKGYDDKLQLLKYRQKDNLVLYSLESSGLSPWLRCPRPATCAG